MINRKKHHLDGYDFIRDNIFNVTQQDISLPDLEFDDIHIVLSNCEFQFFPDEFYEDLIYELFVMLNDLLPIKYIHE